MLELLYSFEQWIVSPASNSCQENMKAIVAMNHPEVIKDGHGSSQHACRILKGENSRKRGKPHGVPTIMLQRLLPRCED